MTGASEIYGKSLYDLTAEENLTDKIIAEMEVVKGLFDENPDYAKLLSEPSIPKKERLKLLDDAFGSDIHPYLLNFLKVLLEKGMVRDFAGCCRRYRTLYNADHGITEAVVTTAVPLTADQKEQLLKKLEKVSGKTIFLKERVDADVLGGIRVDMEGKLFDGTVKGRLADLRKKVDEVVV